MRSCALQSVCHLQDLQADALPFSLIRSIILRMWCEHLPWGKDVSFWYVALICMTWHHSLGGSGVRRGCIAWKSFALATRGVRIYWGVSAHYLFNLRRRGSVIRETHLNYNWQFRGRTLVSYGFWCTRSREKSRAEGRFMLFYIHCKRQLVASAPRTGPSKTRSIYNL